MPRAAVECGNPLWRDWIKEWAEDQRHTKAYFTYMKAYNALAKCGQEFTHPCEAIQLPGIGEVLVNRLERQLQKYCQENGLPMPQRPKRGQRRTIGDDYGDQVSGFQQRKRRAPRTYVPKYRTGPYAILLSLLEYREANNLVNATKEQIVRLAEPHCDSSFDMPAPGGSYTAWNSIKTLMSKDYVYKHGSPARYTLTETGLAMAQQLKETGENGGARPCASSSSSSSQSIGQQQNDLGEGDVDLSLYVLDPARYRASMASRSSQSRPHNTEPDYGEEEVDLSLYVTDPDSYRASMRNNSSQPQPHVAQEDNVDLSLYVLDPDRYRANSASRTSNTSRASSIPRTNGTTRVNSTSRTNSSSQPQPRNTEEDVDLSLYVTNPERYLASVRNDSSRNRSLNSQRAPERTTDEEEPVDLSLYVTDPANFHSQVATPTNTSTQISLLDDDDDGPPNTLNNNEVFSRYPSPTPLATNSSYNPGNFDDDGIIELDSPSPPPSPLRPSQPFLSSLPDPDDISLPDSDYGSQTIFQYTFVDPDNKPVRHISQAAVKIYDEQVLYKVRYSSGQFAHPRTDKVRDVESDIDNTFSGYIAETHCDVICPGLPLSPLIPLNREQEDDFWPTPNIAKSANSTPFSSQVTDSQMTASQMEEYVEYPPDSYEVVLVLDTREIKLRTNRDYFLEQLTAKGIRVVKRALDLGDMLWVARKKGSMSTDDELFLDFIVERKRMDDLVSSIKDGRYNEQKYRLRNCGAEKVFYIIEEFNKEDAMTFGAQAIQTAMSSTQAVDGFFLKRTASINDTIDYLVNMTKMVEQIYHNATLYRIPAHAVTRTGYLEQKKRLGKNHLVSYPIFSELNSKSDTLTIKDVYLRMLMTVRGVSAEKASALMKIYPTPYQLLQAYASITEEEGKALARKATKDGIQRRRWGQQLSERLWEVWGDHKQ
ncbi:hypothetical protein BJV82DRAFT_671051 [Fennellomyces sp. T-0311]|nr:hypothetical protein BJV82DRAFT_671051 [Fennellomyces sp. T-0311]